MKIGVLGGTFDPPHNGHLAAAREAQMRLGLERVLFIPAGDPWMKAGNPITPVEQRVEMVELAIAGKPGFSLSRLEADRPGPSYTADTLEALRWEFGHKAELFLILGLDSLAGLHRWHRPERIAHMCTVVAVTRPGVAVPEAEILERHIPGLRGRLVLLEGLYVDMSSTEVRRRVAAGDSIEGLVPEAVERYIGEKGLYRQARV